jgi:hypothetical protein
MTFTDYLEARQTPCETGLARLRMLADSDAAGVPGTQIAAEVREVTNAVIAEAEAAGHAALAATVGARGELEVETFLWVRLARLAAAADDAVDLARTSDANGLRRHLHRFDDLARAMWTVQRALYGQVPLPRSQGRRTRHDRGSAGP